VEELFDWVVVLAIVLVIAVFISGGPAEAARRLQQSVGDMLASPVQAVLTVLAVAAAALTPYYIYLGARALGRGAFYFWVKARVVRNREELHDTGELMRSMDVVESFKPAYLKGRTTAINLGFKTWPHPSPSGDLNAPFWRPIEQVKAVSGFSWRKIPERLAAVLLLRRYWAAVLRILAPIVEETLPKQAEKARKEAEEKAKREAEEARLREELERERAAAEAIDPFVRAALGSLPPPEELEEARRRAAQAGVSIRPPPPPNLPGGVVSVLQLLIDPALGVPPDTVCVGPITVWAGGRRWYGCYPVRRACSEGDAVAKEEDLRRDVGRLEEALRRAEGLERKYDVYWSMLAGWVGFLKVWGGGEDEETRRLMERATGVSPNDLRVVDAVYEEIGGGPATTRIEKIVEILWHYYEEYRRAVGEALEIHSRLSSSCAPSLAGVVTLAQW